MRNSKIRFLSIILSVVMAFSALLFKSPVIAEAEDSIGAVSGRLLDLKGNPFPSVALRIAPENIYATTNSRGQFCFEDIQSGYHDLYLLENNGNELFCTEVLVKKGLRTKLSDISYCISDSGNNSEQLGEGGDDAGLCADSLSWYDLVAKMPASLRGTTLTVLSWNPVTDVPYADKVISRFENKTGIKVNWNQVSYDTYEAKIAALVNANKSPDLIRFIAPTPSRMSLCQDLRTATGFDFKGDIWDKRVTSSYSYKGAIYAANLKNTLNQQPSVVLYRPSMIERYKLDNPYTLWKSGKWTYDKFKEICTDFKEETGRPAWMTSAMLDYLWLNDIDLITFDGTKYKNNLSDPKVTTGLQEIIRCRSEICPEAMGTGSKIEDGTYLFYTDNILACRTTDFHFTELKAKNDLEAVPFPTQPGKPYYTNFQEFEAYGVPKGAPNGEAVYYFLRCYLDADNYDESTFFCSSQTLEVYEYLMNQQYYNFNVDRRITDAAGNQNGGIHTMIRTGEMTQAQVIAKLDSLSPFFDKAVKQANDTLAKFNGGISYGSASENTVVSLWAEYFRPLQGKPGDINDDDSVNNKDLTRLFQYLSDWDVEINEALLDVNGDGSVNNKDLTRLFQYLSDWDVEIF